MKKTSSIGSSKPDDPTRELTAPKTIEPTKSNGQVDDQIAEPTAIDGGRDTPTVSDEPLPKNRAAFLLGFYAQLPNVDAIVEPMLAVCDGPSTTKVMLLDNCLARNGIYDIELPELRWNLDTFPNNSTSLIR